ncbi:hypothetical protein TRFO_08352 [Tritrichomonas foetus]|uniref:Uncharacterized protein n=1 Tax=Tritrichomonas foetus TaxID=1144522 RepID=A0A1J4JL84_9EUKA|nr:hypothetical protein TRFO_08352 [Tritrichomonas foetus]|eukprot:OHS99433.1 hypothetical protein TRFO_08352 [Tritrichomonas foetus]
MKIEYFIFSISKSPYLFNQHRVNCLNSVLLFSISYRTFYYPKMQQQLILFQSVLTSLLESFSPQFNQVISEYDKYSSLENQKTKISKSKIIKIFEKFPRKAAGYSDIVKTLMETAACNPTDILRFCGKMMKDTLTFSVNTPLNYVYSNNHDYDPSNKHHFVIFYYFSTFLLTDLIHSIVLHYKCSKSFNLLARVGLAIGVSKMLVLEVDKIIINQWAVIFSIISEFSCQELTDIFPSFPDPHIALQIMKYVRLDQSEIEAEKFIPQVISVLQKLHRKKQILSEDLENVSNLIISVKINDDFFAKIFEIAYSYRSDKDVGLGAAILCMVMIQKWPKKKSLLSHFIEKRIFHKTDNKNALLHAIKGLRLYIYGSQIAPEWYFWSWGENTRVDPIDFISWSSLDELNVNDTDYFSKIFLKYYFMKINYQIEWNELEQLSEIILHLASINFKSFVQKITPIFLKLKDDDCRFVAFVKTIKEINSTDFIKKAISNIDIEILNDFNSIIHEKLLNSLLKYDKDSSVDSVVFDAKDLLATNHIHESDTQIEEILEDWKINEFTATPYVLHETEYNEGDTSLYPQLSSALQFILTDEDYQNPEILEKLIEMSYDHNRSVSSTAFSLCKNISKQQNTTISMLSALVFEIHNRMTPEALFVIETILFFVLSSAEASKITDKTLFKLEYEAFFCMCSAYPMVRHLAFHILRKINHMLNNKGLLYFVASNQQAIENAVKTTVISYAPPKNPIPQEILDDSVLKFENDSSFTTNSAVYDDDEDSISESSVSMSTSFLQSNRFSVHLEKVHRLSELRQARENKRIVPSQSIIKFDICLLSHYYGLWLIFIKQIMNVVIEINYTPLIFNIDQQIDIRLDRHTSTENLNIDENPSLDTENEKDSNILIAPKFTNVKVSPSSIGSLIPCLSTLYYYPSLHKYKKISNSDQFEPLKKDDRSDKRRHLCKILKKWLDSDQKWLNDVAISCIELIHFSLVPKVIKLLTQVKKDLFSDSIHAISIVLKSPDISDKFLRAQIKYLINFISNAQYTISELGLNGPRMISWTPEKEADSVSHQRMIQDFCIICEIAFSNFKVELLESIWPQDQRQVTSRFFINWLTTKSPFLETVRLYSSRALASIVKLGPIFTDSLLFDSNIASLFGQIDLIGLDVLKPLLSFHYEQLLNNFIHAFFFEKFPISDHYFRAIIENITEQHSHYSSLLSGPLLFLGLVSAQISNPYSHQFIERFLRTVGPMNQVKDVEIMIETIQTTPPQEVLPTFFKYATEAVFATFFKIVKRNDLLISIKDIVDAITPWLKQIRLLPSQLTCAQGVSNMFAFFTPYQFLVNLMEATENVPPEQFCFMASIWIELLKTQDHTHLIPEFIISWGNQMTMRAMYSVLLHSKPIQMCQKAILSYSFSYYFHSTIYYNNSFDQKNNLQNSTNSMNKNIMNSINKIVSFKLTKTKSYINKGDLKNPNILQNTSSSKQINFPIHDQITRSRDNNDFIDISDISDSYMNNNDQSSDQTPKFHINIYSDFEKELWMTSLLIPLLKNNWEIVKPRIPYLLHFSLLFRDTIPHLFAMLCEKFDIDYPDPSYEIMHLNETLHKFIRIMKNSDDPKALATWADEALKWVFGSPSLRYAALSFYIYLKIDSISANIISIDGVLINSIIRTVSYHLSQYHSEDEDLITLLVSCSFEFARMHYNIDLNLAFAYCSCFLDCRPFVENSLVKALPVFKAAMNDPNLINYVKSSLISIIRPTITKLEHDSQCRKSFGECIAKYNSEEMKTIIVPLKKANPAFFSDLPNAQEILEKASISSLCKALAHFSLMMTTASHNLLNCIFEVSAFIVNKVVDDNNKYPLARIYINAIRNISSCPKAIEFIKTIAVKQPTVVGIKLIDVYEWNRSIENVSRNLEHCVKPVDIPPATLTDCPNYQSVIQFLYTDVPPKILPYETSRELIDNLKKVQRPSTSRRAFALPKAPLAQKVPLTRAVIKPMAVQNNELASLNSSESAWGPILHPEKLVIKPDDFIIQKTTESAVSRLDFFADTKKSPSMTLPQLRRQGTDEKSS